MTLMAILDGLGGECKEHVFPSLTEILYSSLVKLFVEFYTTCTLSSDAISLIFCVLLYGKHNR